MIVCVFGLVLMLIVNKYNDCVWLRNGEGKKCSNGVDCGVNRII